MRTKFTRSIGAGFVGLRSRPASVSIAATVFMALLAPTASPAQTPPATQAAPRAKTANLAVSDQVLVDSGDTKIYVEIRGRKKNAPVLLVLHEGPGNAIGILALEAYPGVELEKSRLVAYMHQRGVLHSPAVPAESQTIANHVRDIDNVVEYLKKRFGKQQVSILGHSWGGVLGYLYVIQHGEKIDKLVAAAAPFNMASNQLASYEMTLQWARDTNNQIAADALVRLGPPPYRTSRELLQKTLLSADAYGGIARNLDMSKVLAAGDFTEYDPRWGDRQMEIGDAMFAETQQIDVEDDVARVKTPLLLIGARNDAEVPYFALRTGFDKWGGKKEFVVFERSNHIVFLDEPQRFVDEIARFLAK